MAHLLRLLWLALGGLLVLTPRGAHAYTIYSPVSEGCHERITSAALRAIRRELSTAPAVAAGRNDQALIDDLEFRLADDMRDLGAATLIAAVRDNDTKGRHSVDLKRLALIHGDPDAQPEHCLRGPNRKEPRGSALAVEDCRAFIRERVGQALEGLGATGKPDLDKRTTLPIYLTLRHRVRAPLPTYYVRMGQAIHAIEDSFTHTFRSPDGLHITVVLNWIDQANNRLDEEKDGPGHAGDFDRCDDPDELRTKRRDLATEAVTAVLRLTLDPTTNREQKTDALEAMLDRYVAYKPGCTFDNDWCDAPEREYGAAPILGCALSPAQSGGLSGAWVALLGLVACRRRTRHAGSGVLHVVALCLLFAGAVALHDIARAQDLPTPDGHHLPPPRTTPVEEPGPKNPSELAWGGYTGVTGSYDYGALAFQGALRLRVKKYLTVGLDAEWNPWFSSASINNNSPGIRRGVFNGYGTAILRLPLKYEHFNLRSTLNVGFSRLLIDLYGAPKGTTGVFVGFTPLGLEWKLSRFFYLIVNPLGIAVPIPQVGNVPFAYTQYRIGVGLEFYGR